MESRCCYLLPKKQPLKCPPHCSPTCLQCKIFLKINYKCLLYRWLIPRNLFHSISSFSDSINLADNDRHSQFSYLPITSFKIHSSQLTCIPGTRILWMELVISFPISCSFPKLGLALKRSNKQKQKRKKNTYIHPSSNSRSFTLTSCTSLLQVLFLRSYPNLSGSHNQCPKSWVYSVP